MNNKKVFIGMIGLTTLLSLAIIAVTVLSANMLKRHSTKLVELKLEDSLIGEQQTALLMAKKDIEKYKELGDIARAIVPQDKDQAKTVRDIVQIAKENNIVIETVTFPSSNLGDKRLAAPTGEQGEQSQPAVVAPTISQVKPVSGINGVFALQLDVSPSVASPVSYNELINFLNRLENNRRTAQISRISITPKGSELTFNLSINIFIKP